MMHEHSVFFQSVLNRLEMIDLGEETITEIPMRGQEITHLRVLEAEQT